MKSTTTSVNISMPSQLKRIMQKRMAEEGFENASEYVRQLIRADAGVGSSPPTIRTKADLERALLEGLQSGPAVPVTPKLWDDLRKRVANRSRSRRKSA